MNVRRETSVRVETRLRRVLRDSELTVLPGSWWFDEFEHPVFSDRVRADAIALTRDGDHWSQLVPLRADDKPRERLRAWSVHFPPEQDNSGFVGWLATHIKRATGSGVVVVCGQNSRRGGIFDYWACPELTGDQVIETLNVLGATMRTGDRAPEHESAGSPVTASAPGWDLDGVVMHVAVTAANGEVDAATIFRFRQQGSHVSCTYSGGAVVEGFLVGNVERAVLDFVYVQSDQQGRLDAGTSRGELDRLPDGRLRMIEHFRWFTRAGRGCNEFVQLDQSR
jgi:uncharacterized protein DUF6196